MKLTRHDAARTILSQFEPVLHSEYSAQASANIALCKYWGKRNPDLNLPVNDSLSISLGNKGTHTTIRTGEGITEDSVILNGKCMDTGSVFYQRTIGHIDLFRKVYGSQAFQVETDNSISTAAGLASSASGFAALTRALAGIYGLSLDSQALSILARLGSGSACRSIFNGFVIWKKGEKEDGSDSHAVPLSNVWPELRIGIVNISKDNKAVSSREGMRRTVRTSPLFSAWASQAHSDIVQIKKAVELCDIGMLGTVSEHNALGMHATMLSSWPPLLYWTPDTVKALHTIWQLRKEGVQVYLTMDAGPNIKLIFERKDEPIMKDVFSSIDIVRPFYSNDSLQKGPGSN